MSETEKHWASEPEQMLMYDHPAIWRVDVWCGTHLCSGWLRLTPEEAAKAAEEEIKRLDKEAS